MDRILWSEDNSLIFKPRLTKSSARSRIAATSLSSNHWHQIHLMQPTACALGNVKPFLSKDSTQPLSDAGVSNSARMPLVSEQYCNSGIASFMLNIKSIWISPAIGPTSFDMKRIRCFDQYLISCSSYGWIIV